MRLPPPILLWITLYSLLSLSVTRAQAPTTQEEVTHESESDPLNKWKELLCWTGPDADGECSLCTLGSTTSDCLLSRPPWEALLHCAQELFNPAYVAERFQGSILRAMNSENIEWTDFPHDESDRLQQTIESLLSQDFSKILTCLETPINSALDPSTSTSSNPPLTPLLKKLAKLMANMKADFSTRFPLPSTAPGHAPRVERVKRMLDRIEWVVVQLASSLEIEREVVGFARRVRPYLQDLLVLIGDVGELYPGVVEAIVLNLSGMVVPDATLIWSVVILYWFGPYVLGKDAISEWVLKYVVEAFKV